MTRLTFDFCLSFFEIFLDLSHKLNIASFDCDFNISILHFVFSFHVSLFQSWDETSTSGEELASTELKLDADSDDSSLSSSSSSSSSAAARRRAQQLQQLLPLIVRHTHSKNETPIRHEITLRNQVCVWFGFRELQKIRVDFSNGSHAQMLNLILDFFVS